MSAAEQVGSLPEIVELIIEFLEFDRPTLYSAHLVNNTWAYHARKVLWRNAPFVSLVGVDPCRQQYYANMIQTSCTWLAWWHADLDKLSFPSLKRFLFDLWFVFGYPEYRRLLPPFFKTFPQYLDLWVKRRTAEKRLALKSSHEYESRGFEAKLVGRPRADRTATRKMVEIMSRLDFRENCEDLFLWDFCFSHRLIASLLSADPQRPVFPNIKHFGAYIADDPGASLSALLPLTLSSLYLGLGDIDGPGPWFDSITHFKALQSLTLEPGAGFLDSRTSSLLGRLHSIRSLVIQEISCPTKPCSPTMI